MIIQDDLSRTKSKRKKKIVESAHEMFLESGVSATSMNDIAEQCGITRRTIYNYFDSKTDLLNFLMVEMTERIDPDFHLIYDDSINALENMSKLLRTNFESYYKHMTDFLFITQVRTHLSYELEHRAEDDRSKQMHRAFISEIEDVISKGYADGSIGEKDTEINALAKMLYQSLYGYLTNISLGVTVEKNIYTKKCASFEKMIIGYLASK